MTFSDDCPCGRSQDLTFAESSDKFLVDRKTFEELLLLVGWCRTELVKSALPNLVCEKVNNFYKD